MKAINVLGKTWPETVLKCPTPRVVRFISHQSLPKNKIEGTPILKLAMVKRSKIHQENCQENSSKKIRQNILQTHRQNIRQNVKKVPQNISSKKFLKKILQINSSNKFAKKIPQKNSPNKFVK